jgi:hypothetical protein
MLLTRFKLFFEGFLESKSFDPETFRNCSLRYVFMTNRIIIAFLNKRKDMQSHFQGRNLRRDLEIKEQSVTDLMTIMTAWIKDPEAKMEKQIMVASVHGS